MKKIAFVSLEPNFIESYFSFGVFRSFLEQGGDIKNVNLRDFAVDGRGSVDDRPYGGGDSMILRPEPLFAAKNFLEKEYDEPLHVIATSPKGETLHHKKSCALAATSKPLVFFCGRFGGFDQRFLDHGVDEIISLGSFVVSGGELPALMICDAALRQIPGVLGNQQSATHDSFAIGEGCLEAPQYTRPEEFQNMPVPEILLSGDHKKIKSWRQRFESNRAGDSSQP